MSILDKVMAIECAATLSLDGIDSYDAALVAAVKECRFELDAFIEDVAEQLWQRAHAALTARENEAHDAADFPDPGRMEGGCSTMADIFGPPRPRMPLASFNALPMPGLALDPATYSWCQQHRRLIAALMAGEAVVAPK